MNAHNFGATFSTSGFQNGAASFNGVKQYFQVPIDVDIGPLPRMTWGAWVKPNVTNGIRAVLSNDDGGFDRDIDIDSRVSGHWGAFRGSGVFDSGITPSTTDFTFLAAVYNQSTNSLTFYVNGTSLSTTSNFGTTAHNFFDIGRNPSFNEFTGGLIDNAFIYNEALTPSQIADIRANGFPVTTAVHGPEPSSLALLALGGIALAGWRRFKKNFRLPGSN